MNVSVPERELALMVAALLCLLPFLPVIAQDPAYHAFADRRAWLGVPNAADTFSNLAFVLPAIAGFGRLWTARPVTAAHWPYALAFAGLAATAAGSGWYHGQPQPDDAGLALDRAGMVIAFAGVLGIAGSQTCGARAGTLLTLVALVGGLASVAWWLSAGNLAPYGLMQFGGLLLLVVMLVRFGATGPGPRWRLVIGAYVAAKLFEWADVPVFTLTGGFVSGHTLKHLVAGLGAMALLPGGAALSRFARRR